ncbi:MAG: hypothetical protein AB7U73_01890 [Pirellulales bacterium]
MSVEVGVLLAALALLTLGCSLAWLPLGPIVLGALLLCGLIWTRLHTPRRPIAVPVPDKPEEPK